MNKKFDHHINSRVLNTFTAIDWELQLDKQKNYLFDLSYLSVLSINGEKALDFLQGQLTCDVNLINDIHMNQGAQCTLKGRILSLLDILQWNGFKLILPQDLVESTQNSLTKTAQLSRVTINTEHSLKVFGFYLQNPKDLLASTLFFPHELYSQAHTAEYCYYHLGNGFYIFLVKSEYAESFCQPFADQEQLLGSLTWHSLRLLNGQIEIYPESRGLFLPHRLDLHLTPFLSFDKGCYKGQEIIARTHYKGTLKHELHLYQVNSVSRIYSGQKLFKADSDVEVGELVDYSDLGNKHFLIAVSILKGAETTVRFEGNNNPITLLPYPHTF